MTIFHVIQYPLVWDTPLGALPEWVQRTYISSTAPSAYSQLGYYARRKADLTALLLEYDPEVHDQ